MSKKKRRTSYIKYSYDDTFVDPLEKAEEYRVERMLKEGLVKSVYATKTIKAGNQFEVEIYPEFTKKEADVAKLVKTNKAQKNLNSKNARKRLERLINNNFTDGDLWITMTYSPENLPQNIEEAQKNIDFMENCVRLTKAPFYNKPMKLMLWQKAFIEVVYSFKMADTGFERFKKIVLLIARKNTKSETCSALALTELIIGEPGNDIVCSSNDDNQASIVYDAIDLMRTLIDPDDLDTKRNQRYILNRTTNTKVFKMSDRTRNKEGRNIGFAIVDETHEMKTNIIGKSIEQSQSLKDNPKFINITTEGFINDGYLDEELKKCRAIISGEDDGIMAERTLPWLYTQDSEREVWEDEKSWMKSNPSLGIVKKWDYLREQVDAARTSKADRMFVLSKDFNFKQSNAQSWLEEKDYIYDAKFDIEKLRGKAVIGAVDLSETTDLTCAKIMALDDETNTKFVHTMYFIPEGKLLNSDDKSSGAKYKEWAEQGILTILPGLDNDLTKVADCKHGTSRRRRRRKRKKISDDWNK